MRRELTPAELDTLERMIDASSLTAVIAGLVDIADGKALHIESNWQDKTTARPWHRMAGRLATESRNASAYGV